MLTDYKIKCFNSGKLISNCIIFYSNGSGSKMNGSLEHLDQPDPDSIKMFVGQIPRSWSETELKELFEPFGAVHQINILRDRTQNPPQSKGTDWALLSSDISLRQNFSPPKLCRFQYKLSQ